MTHLAAGRIKLPGRTIRVFFLLKDSGDLFLRFHWCGSVWRLDAELSKQVWRRTLKSVTIEDESG